MTPEAPVEARTGHGDARDADVEDLLALVRQVRAQVARHAASGTWAAPGGASPVDEVASDESADEASPEPPAPAAPPESPAAPDPPPSAPPLVEIEALAASAPDLAVVAAAPPATTRRSLAQVRADLGSCTRCKLHATRHSLVFGAGLADAPLVVVGEAPGEEEDFAGDPFVGRAGKLLDQLLGDAGLARDRVYVTNVLKCRPPRNRNPQLDEVLQCRPVLHAQIAAVGPRVVVALGRPAANELLGTDAPISSLRGRVHDYARASGGARIAVVPTFHPAYLLREPGKRALSESDLRLAVAELARRGGA